MFRWKKREKRNKKESETEFVDLYRKPFESGWMYFNGIWLDICRRSLFMHIWMKSIRRSGGIENDGKSYLMCRHITWNRGERLLFNEMKKKKNKMKKKIILKSTVVLYTRHISARCFYQKNIVQTMKVVEMSTRWDSWKLILILQRWWWW